PVEHGRGAGDRAVRLEAPLDVARRGVEAEELAAVRAGVDALAPDGGRGVDVAAGRPRPAQLPRPGAERVDLAVGRADVDAAVGDRRRRVERPGRAEPRLARRAPGELPGARVDRVDVA